MDAKTVTIPVTVPAKIMDNLATESLNFKVKGDFDIL
jgi:hypothetical protein